MKKEPKQLGPFTIHPDRGRSKSDRMGRFGGGWQYKLGITAGELRDGRMTILVGLWSKEYRVEYRTKDRRAADALRDAEEATA